MPALFIPSRRERQPSGDIRLAPSHWAYDAIIQCVVPNVNRRDLKTGQVYSDVNSPAIIAESDGLAVYSSSWTSYWSMPDSASNSASKIIAVARYSATSGTGDGGGPLHKREYYGQGWDLHARFSALTSNNFPTFAFYDGGWRSVSAGTDIRGTGYRTLIGAYDGSSLRIAVDGAISTSAYSGSLPDTAADYGIGGDNNTGAGSGGTSLAYLLDGSLIANHAEAILELSDNPWAVFQKDARRVYFIPSAGGGGATGTGAPAAQSATVAGTATRTVTGSGAPAAQAATASGTAEREITSSGTPAAQSATVSGTGTVGAVVTGSGSPQAQSATVAGTAERTVTASGTVAAQSATVAGTAEREITSSGTPTAQSATVVGAGQVGNIITGSGAPTAQSATVAGTAEREVTSSGSPSAQSATVAGTAVRTITGSGSPQAQSATVYGYDSVPDVPSNTGGGGIGRVYSSKKLRKEVDEWLEKQQEAEKQKLLARLQREDEELMVIMLALAA